MIKDGKKGDIKKVHYYLHHIHDIHQHQNIKRYKQNIEKEITNKMVKKEI